MDYVRFIRPDFAAVQATQLQELAAEHNVELHLTPKFHCELVLAENGLAFVKKQTRVLLAGGEIKGRSALHQLYHGLQEAWQSTPAALCAVSTFSTMRFEQAYSWGLGTGHVFDLIRVIRGTGFVGATTRWHRKTAYAPDGENVRAGGAHTPGSGSGQDSPGADVDMLAAAGESEADSDAGSVDSIGPVCDLPEAAAPPAHSVITWDDLSRINADDGGRAPNVILGGYFQRTGKGRHVRSTACNECSLKADNEPGGALALCKFCNLVMHNRCIFPPKPTKETWPWPFPLPGEHWGCSECLDLVAADYSAAADGDDDERESRALKFAQTSQQPAAAAAGGPAAAARPQLDCERLWRLLTAWTLPASRAQTDRRWLRSGQPGCPNVKAALSALVARWPVDVVHTVAAILDGSAAPNMAHPLILLRLDTFERQFKPT
jgi:hypothetical protein